MQASKLTAKQAKWVHEYLACGNATASAVRAGFSPKGASVAGVRMLRNASVRAELEAFQRADATRLSITRENVLNGLLTSVEQAREQRNPMTLLRGWVEIAKLLGLFPPTNSRMNVHIAGEGAEKHLNQMTDAELLALIVSDGGGATAH